MEAEIILAALHIAVHIVALHAGSGLSESRGYLVEAPERIGDAAHDALERAESVGKLTLTAATGDGEVELHVPVTFVIGCLNRRDAGGIGHALEGLRGIAAVLAAQGEIGIGRLDGTRLVGVLPVEAEVETFGEEGHTSGIAVYAIEADGAITCGIAQEVDTLIRVGQDATSRSVCGGCCQHHAGQNYINFVHNPKNILKNRLQRYIY